MQYDVRPIYLNLGPLGSQIECQRYTPTMQLSHIVTCISINHLPHVSPNSIVSIYFDMTMSIAARYHSPDEVQNKHLDVELQFLILKDNSMITQQPDSS